MTQGYRRLRNGFPDVHGRDDVVERPEDLEWILANREDSLCDCVLCSGLSSLDQVLYDVDVFLSELVARPQTLLPIPEPTEHQLEKNEVEPHASSTEPLEMRLWNLWKFVDTLACSEDGVERKKRGRIDHSLVPPNPVAQARFKQQIRDFVDGEENLRPLRDYAEQSGGPEIAKWLCLWSPFWLRRPKTWRPSQGDLLRHLFVRYEVPSYLYPCWYRRQDISWMSLHSDKWMYWFVLLGQGGSPRRAAKRFGWRYPVGIEPFLSQVTEVRTPELGVLAACVLQLGGSLQDFLRITAESSLVFDPTENRHGDRYHEYWRSVVRWLAAHRDELTDEQCLDVTGWSWHKHTERERQSSHRPPFSLESYSVADALAQSLEYQRQIQNEAEAAARGYSWAAHGWNWQYRDDQDQIWEFVELTSSRDLFQEGLCLRHCVGTYDKQCTQGYSAIVSLRLNGERRATIEINVSTGKIVQARGKKNRALERQEQMVIDRWMSQFFRGSGSDSSP